MREWTNSIDGTIEYWSYEKNCENCCNSKLVESNNNDNNNDDDDEIEIEYSELLKLSPSNYYLIDIRNNINEENEIAYSKPVEFLSTLQLDKNSIPIYIICEYGIRSKEKVVILRNKFGVSNIFSIKYGYHQIEK